ncbi:MAG: tetratricopeptide repeat protein, partial [Solirubrobacterales bacterium]|nr:tetratricopeptide repeat protein [Solirubrobacterales bacterium]
PLRRDPRTEAPPHTTRPRQRTASPGRRAWPLALLALLCLAAGAGAALISDGGNEPADQASTPAKPRTTEKRQATSTTPAPAAEPAQTQEQAPAETQAQPTQTSPAPPADDGRTPAQLNDAGFAMLPGNPQGAVPLLQRSVDGFRKDGDKGDVNYAYALYNLGWALRLSGRPADAIPYLEERLQISDYKRGVVKKELKLARQQAGQG